MNVNMQRYHIQVPTKVQYWIHIMLLTLFAKVAWINIFVPRDKHIESNTHTKHNIPNKINREPITFSFLFYKRPFQTNITFWQYRYYVFMYWVITCNNKRCVNLVIVKYVKNIVKYINPFTLIPKTHIFTIKLNVFIIYRLECADVFFFVRNIYTHSLW